MLKRSMDVLDIHAITKKYNEDLVGCFIDNIYFSKHYWLFKLRCKTSGLVYLKIEPGIRFHRSKFEPRERRIDRFTAFMRKYLRGGRITDIEHIGWERIVSMEITRKDKYKLIAEIIPRGFLVLVDKDERILYANKFAELRDRIIKIRQYYKPPPGNIDRDVYFNSLKEKIKVGKDLVRGIVKGWGLPGYIAEEILYRSSMYSYKNKKVDEVSNSELDVLIEKYFELINESINYKGYLVLLNNTKYLYTLYKPLLFIEQYETIVKEYDNADVLIDIYFNDYEKQILLREKQERIEEERRSIEKSIEEQLKIIQKYRETHNTYEKYVNLLTRNYVLVDKALKCAQKIRAEKDWEQILVICNNIVEIDKSRGLIYISLDNEKIPLDIRLDVWNNINHYRKLSGEYRAKVERAEKYVLELKNRLREIISKSEKAIDIIVKGLRPRFWFEKFHWMFTSNNFLVIAGRDADQNELLVKKYLTPRDIFLHADIHGAPATILKVNKRAPSETDLREASVLAACYSRGWKEGLGFLDVYWVRGDQVSKTPPSGEYLGKGAFMVYGERRYIRVELKLGVGVEEVCDPIYGVYHRVIVGPPELVSRRSLIYAVLVPGDSKRREIAEKLYRKFNEKISTGLALNIDEILLRIPGSSRIIYCGLGESKPCEE